MVKPEALFISEFVEKLRLNQTSRAAAYLDSLIVAGEIILSDNSWKIIEKAISIYRKKSLPKNRLSSIKDSQSWGWGTLNEKILKNEKLNILFINDVGFNAGAGIGVHRQVQSFLNKGDDVSLIAFHKKINSNKFDLTQYAGNLVNCIDVTDLQEKGELTVSGLKKILGLVVGLNPDIIISGNFHARSLSAKILMRINELNYPVVAYAHDCDWVTGGCAHFLYHNCEQYLTGCSTTSCPKPPNSYPPTKVKNIGKNWLERGEVFAGSNKVPIAVNSAWVKEIFQNRYKNNAIVEKVTLGLNTNIYKFRNKVDAKKRIGISQENKVILVGSGFFGTRGKGGELLGSLFERFASSENILFCLIGNADKDGFPPNVKHLGYVVDDLALAWIYAAADVFVNPVTIEAFGQTMLEALACGCPIVSLNACGVGEISVDGLTAVHCDDNIESISEAIIKVLGNVELHSKLQKNGRYLVEQYFSLDAQYNNWRQFLIKVSYKKMMEEKHFINMTNDGKEDIGKMVPPLVTVVTVTYNVGKEFRNTANSIITQSSLNFEWIVIDGMSSSNSLSIINEYAEQIDTFVSEHDNGIYDAMNKSVKYAKGEFVIFLGAGDVFSSKDAIKEFSEYSNKETDVIYGNVFELRQDGKVIPTKVVDFDKKWRDLKCDIFPLEPIMRGLPPHQATFVRRRLIEKHKFDLNYKVSADWDLIFKLYSLGYKFKKVDFTFAWYPNGGFSAVHSVQWLKDVRSIMDKYAVDKQGLNEYFDKVESNQKRIVEMRTEQEELKENYLNWIYGGYRH